MSINLDYEHEYNKDYIYALERQKDIEASWETEEHYKQKAKIEIVYEHKPSTFRRTAKKILHARSRLFADINRFKHIH